MAAAFSAVALKPHVTVLQAKDTKPFVTSIHSIIMAIQLHVALSLRMGVVVSQTVVVAFMFRTPQMYTSPNSTSFSAAAPLQISAQ